MNLTKEKARKQSGAALRRLRWHCKGALQAMDEGKRSEERRRDYKRFIMIINAEFQRRKDNVQQVDNNNDGESNWR